MKSKIGALALGMVVALAGCGAAPGSVEEVSAPALRSVETEVVQTSDIASHFTYSGQAVAKTTVGVVPNMPGKVTSYNFEVGDAVAEGQVLFTVDSSDLQSSLNTTQANYEVSKLGLENQKTTYENSLILFEQGVISQAEMDQVTHAYESALAGLSATEIQMSSLRSDIADNAVKSPLTGVVTDRSVEVGAMASQSSPSYTVMDLSTMKLEIGVSEQVINDITVGESVEVSLTAVSPSERTGTIATVSPAADASGTYAVTIHLDNADGAIKSGMLAQARFVKESASNAIVLASDVIQEEDGEQFVYLLQDGMAKKTVVSTGIASGETIEVTSGLSMGDELIVKGQTYLSDGEEVMVNNPTTEAVDEASSTTKED